jgi:hypothetical protein
LNFNEDEGVVRDFYKYIEEKNFEGIRELIHDDFKWVGLQLRSGVLIVYKNQV